MFPGQGSQYSGMGKVLYENSILAKNLFKRADDILNFPITDIMCDGSEDELKKTRVTQPAIFLHSIISFKILENNFKPDLVVGHSLGEFSALVAAKAISFEDGLALVFKRAQAMQDACNKSHGAMAAILGLENKIIEDVCQDIKGIVVVANYNCPGQLVISGEKKSVNVACEKLKEKGAKRTIMLSVSGAFHSPLMLPAEKELEIALKKTIIKNPICPVYQNSIAKGIINSNEIRENLYKQLTAPVKWTQSIREMIKDGAKEFIEIGPGKVLKGLVKKIDDEVEII